MIHPSPSIQPSTTTDITGSTIRSHDLRELGLATATKRLNASVADLDVVFVARARTDLRYCPACPMPHPVEI